MTDYYCSHCNGKLDVPPGTAPKHAWCGHCKRIVSLEDDEGADGTPGELDLSSFSKKFSFAAEEAEADGAPPVEKPGDSGHPGLEDVVVEAVVEELSPLSPEFDAVASPTETPTDLEWTLNTFDEPAVEDSDSEIVSETSAGTDAAPVEAREDRPVQEARAAEEPQEPHVERPPRPQYEQPDAPAESPLPQYEEAVVREDVPQEEVQPDTDHNVGVPEEEAEPENVEEPVEEFGSADSEEIVDERPPKEAAPLANEAEPPQDETVAHEEEPPSAGDEAPDEEQEEQEDDTVVPELLNEEVRQAERDLLESFLKFTKPS